MTDVLLIDRELLERIAKPVVLRSQEDAHADACAELRAILAAPRQPEGDNSENPNLRDGLEVVGLQWLDSGHYRKKPPKYGFNPHDWNELCRLSDAQRATAELREECEHWKSGANAEAARADELKAERDTLRQQLAERDAAIEEWSGTAVQNGMECDRLAAQRDKLAGLLREARELIDNGDFSDGYCMCGSIVTGHSIDDGHAPVDAGEYYAGQVRERIDAALAEVNK